MLMETYDSLACKPTCGNPHHLAETAEERPDWEGG